MITGYQIMVAKLMVILLQGSNMTKEFYARYTGTLRQVDTGLATFNTANVN
jgi:hypothetical protein